MSTAIFAHPCTYGNPAETEIFTKPNAGQGAPVPDLGAFSRLFENPGLRDFEAHRQFFRRQEVRGLKPGLTSCHGLPKAPGYQGHYRG